MKGSKPNRVVKPKPRSAKSDASILLWTHLRELQVEKGSILIYVEHRFDVLRKWRFDFAVRGNHLRLGIEIDGGVWTQGRHTRGSGYVKDLEKFNHASGLHGWRVLHFLPSQVLDGSAIAFIRKVLEAQ